MNKHPSHKSQTASLKRIEGPGVLISDLFRMCLKRYCDNIKKYLEKRQDIITAMSRTNNITSSLKHVFSTGNWAVQKNSYVRTGVSQIMSRLTYPATISHLRRVIIPIGKEGKNVKIRQIHPTQAFFVDIIESPAFALKAEIKIKPNNHTRMTNIFKPDANLYVFVLYPLSLSRYQKEDSMQFQE